eukprot:COSAG01_NODE_1566_length_9890_cov_4.685323_5_plen_101_part_00
MVKLLAARTTTHGGFICDACRPQSLGPANSLISADWPGTTRGLLENLFGGTSLFLLGACGETGPIDQKQADVSVTERLGRQVGYVAAAALESMRPPATGE